MRVFYSICPFRSRACRFFAVFLLALAVFAIGGLAETLFSPDSPVSADMSRALKKQAAKTEEDRQSLISSLGWEVPSSPEQTDEVTIPKKFDKIYTRYNEIQLSQGLDLKRYRGKNCTRYTYEVLNYPDAKDKEVRINLLVYNGKLIGGDICALGLDGFLRNMLFPAKDANPQASAVFMSL